MKRINEMTEEQLAEKLVFRRKARAWIMILAGVIGMVGGVFSADGSMLRIIFVLMVIFGVPGLFILLNADK